MKCVIGSTNMKDFGRAIHSLARIGEELYIEPSKSGVSFRTINSSRSAYFSFDFGSSFFTHFDGGSGGQTSDESKETLKCKVAMKAILNVFRGINNLEKTVQRCKFTLKWEEAKLFIQLFCLYGIVKTHNLSFIECEALQAVYDKSACSSHMVSEPKVLLGALSSFHQQSLEEISFCFKRHNLQLKTHMEEPDPSKVVHTAVTLTFGEFVEYVISDTCELTVCLKEIKSLLAFTGAINLLTKTHFSTPGSPIILTFESKPLYEGTLVLATLVEKPDVGNQSTRKQSHKQAQATPSLSKQDNSINDMIEAGENSSRHNSESITCDDEKSKTSSVQDHHIPDKSRVKSRDKPQPAKEKEDQHSTTLNGDTSQANTSFPSFSESHRPPLEEEEGDSDTVPSTPPPKKTRFFFRRCFEATFNPDSIPGHDVILAEDSDEGES